MRGGNALPAMGPRSFRIDPEIVSTLKAATWLFSKQIRILVIAKLNSERSEAILPTEDKGLTSPIR